MFIFLLVLVLKASLPSPVPDFDVLLTNPPFSADETSWHAWTRLVQGLTVREIAAILCYYICIYGFICLPWVFYDSLNFIDIQALFLCLRLCHEEWETMVHGTDLNVSKHHWLAACDVGMLWLKKTFIEILPVHVIFCNLFTPTRELPFRYERDQWTCRHVRPVDWKVELRNFMKFP